LISTVIISATWIKAEPVTIHGRDAKEDKTLAQRLPDQPKKMLIIAILDILKKYTDADHRLSQKEIADILNKEYDMKADRKSIRRNLLELENYGYELNYSESIRQMPVRDPETGKPAVDPATGEKKMEETRILSDFYLEREFSDSELRLLIDSLLFSQHIPYSQCRELIEKLENLSNVYFNNRCRYISRMSVRDRANHELFLNIDLLDEAISNNRKVSFKYLEYHTDKKLHAKKREDGKDRVYVISPYQMAVREGKYYLICNYDKYNDISNYRLDRITDLKILDEKRKPFKSLKWSNGAEMDLAAYMKAHPYMFSSDNIHAKLRITKPMIGEVIDTFGKEVTFTDETEEGVTVSLTNNEMAIKEFVKRYMPDVLVLEPKKIKENIQSDMRILNQKMKGKFDEG
jgi:predicted DNA-binding transcriptional regulator YafY